jgi:hypothetical protein
MYEENIVMDFINALLGNGSTNTFQHIHAVNQTVCIVDLVWSAHAKVEDLCFLRGPFRVYITGVK